MRKEDISLVITWMVEYINTERCDVDDVDNLTERFINENSIPVENLVTQVEQSGTVKKGGKFENAYKHAMTVLTQYILKSEEKRAKAEREGKKEQQEHYRWKVHFMRTAKATIVENIKFYLENKDHFESRK